MSNSESKKKENVTPTSLCPEHVGKRKNPPDAVSHNA
jgi:hypothetical protein